MDAARRVFDEYGRIMDQEIVAVQLGTYSVALIALTAAIRKVRPFSRFKKPSDIPKHFIEEKRELIGNVKRIDPNGALLMVEHKPLIPLPLVPKGELPVKILGVKVSGLGISWLQSIVVDSEIVFVPVKKQINCLECKVLLPNETALRKKSDEKLLKRLMKKEEKPLLNVGESLVKIGFAEITLIESKNLEQYFKMLKFAEKVALKKRLGIRYYTNPLKDYLEACMISFLNYTRDGVVKILITVKNIPSKMTPA